MTHSQDQRQQSHIYAKEARVTLIRERKAYEIDAALAQHKPDQDPRLVPGDSVQVPRSPF